ncbi:AfsR/SARP family transcriptional regulator [Amycolatopsis suaedae]|uniref:Tetratricopeptide repeat protein n=1 Tax=Amycolatopsis suaedae TaxID=2510978 RepID=A0A4Q7IZZ9_9PSEU|nr:tetratricopeptide repeat protein [Amycolatopsis suaedae]RZQ60099.1 tetratricopeptide repeat protein [Amycolatopsis suaedae]
MRVDVRFRLLGELELLVDGRPVWLGHARQRAVLVALVVDANRLVTAADLIDRVWGERLPRQPREALYGYVSRLRGALDGVATIERRPEGYRLTVDAATVDLHRFDDLLTRARDCTDDARAVELYDEALGLWQGPPLSTTDTPWLESLRASLDRRRVTAELDRDDRMLRLGRHAEVLPELLARVDGATVDERRVGQLMLALYRNGRQPEALDHYRRLRERLADELGTDPGTELQRLHQRILTADPTLTAPASGRRVPRQLPAPPPAFTGRERELAALTGALRQTTVVSVVGGGGMGKTWLALRWAHDHAADFPDGQLYLNLRGFDPVEEPVTPASALRGLLDGLGVAAVPPDLDAQAALYRGLVADRRMLIVLDNARDSTQLAPLLPGGATCAVLVTSRNQLGALVTTHGARPLPLDVLDDTEATDLLTRAAGAARAEAEPAAVADLLRHCAGLPLALGIVAARAATQPGLPLAALADELRDTRLDALDAGEVPANLRAVLAASYRTLNPGTATTFRLLGLAPGPVVTLAGATALTGADAKPALRELTTANLLGQVDADRYRMHDLVRLYAAELASTVDSEQDRAAALTRLYDRYCYLASVAAMRWNPHDEHRYPPMPEPAGPPVQITRGDRWLDREIDILLAITAQGSARHVTHLSSVLARYLDISGRYHDALALHTAAVQLESPNTGRALVHRAGTLSRLGRLDEAIDAGLRADALGRAANDGVTQLIAANSLGTNLGMRGKLDESRQHYERALAIARVIGSRDAEAIAANNLGIALQQLGRLDEAEELIDLSRAIAEESGNGAMGTYVRGSYADLSRERGDYPRAIEHWQQAVEMAHLNGDVGLEVEGANFLGLTVRASGDPEGAVQHHRRALRLATEVHFRYEQARAHDGLARAFHELGRHTEAREHATSALALYRELGTAEAADFAAFAAGW